MKNSYKWSILSITTFLLIGCGGGGDNSSSTNTGNSVEQNRSEVEEEQLSLLDRGFVLSTPYGIEVEEKSPISNQIIKDNIEVITDNNLTYHDSNLFANVSLQEVNPIKDIQFISNSDLLIITHEDFVDELKPLKRHKDATGMPTTIVTWQELVTKFDGRDDAEKIKKAIAYYAKESKIKYVMLVGDVDKFPVRYCKVYDNVIWGDGWVSTDLYYADIYKDGKFASWDGNNNNKFCERVAVESNPKGRLINLDQIEANIDIPVGRVPASTAEEVENYVHKIIVYEKGGYKDYMNNALLLVPGNDKGDDAYPGSTALKDSVAREFSRYPIIRKLSNLKPNNVVINVIKKYHNLRPQDISKSIEDGVGFINFAGHGAYWGWSLGYNNIDYKWTSFGRSDISSLKNQDKFPIIFSVACSTGRYIFDKKFKAKNGKDFDLSVSCKYDPNNHIQGCLPAPQANPLAEYMPEPSTIQPAKYDIDSMAEYFLVKGRDNGAIAFMGSTDATQGAAQTIDQYFSSIYSLEFSWQKNIENPTLGDFWKYTINTYNKNHVNMDKEESNNWRADIPFAHLLKYHLFGDPSLRAWGIE
ncbi:hypothetical protein MNB_SV-13-1812 [hydrothermal vent metagenome]|uniref:Gingipain domain-containing protein n=1 Tax=hydrothermal vent metagenome TaxID=652676 RepID=A0A1W1D0D8_9ZZZZ